MTAMVFVGAVAAGAAWYAGAAGAAW